MVRNYKKTYCSVRNGKNFSPYKSYSNEQLQKAICAVQNSRCSIMQASKEFCVPKSTIGRKIKHRSLYTQPGHPPLFSSEEEKIFVEHLNLVSSWGYPFDTTDLRIIAKAYLDKIGRNVRQLPNNLPGRDWCTNFLKRQKDKLSHRLSANISVKRAALTQEVIENFFVNARQTLENVTPECLVNYDETNLTDNPGAKKFIFKRGCRYPERVINSTKTSVSIMYAGSADGQLLNPYVVYKADHLWDTWTKGGPEGTRYNRTRSGWFDIMCFEDWFFTVVVPYYKHKEGPKVLVGDNLSSHFSKKILDACSEMNISFLCLPPNATHVMQPLDVAFYAPLKKYWRGILTNWKKMEGRKQSVLSKDAFPRLLTKLHEKLMENDKGKQNIISGFNKTGLYPLDPSRPKGRLPSHENKDELQNTSVISDVVVELLTQMRQGDAQTASKQSRRKKLHVEPGKSISAQDLADVNQPSTSYHKKKDFKKQETDFTNVKFR